MLVPGPSPRDAWFTLWVSLWLAGMVELVGLDGAELRPDAEAGDT